MKLIQVVVTSVLIFLCSLSLEGSLTHRSSCCIDNLLTKTLLVHVVDHCNKARSCGDHGLYLSSKSTMTRALPYEQQRSSPSFFSTSSLHGIAMNSSAKSQEGLLHKAIRSGNRTEFCNIIRRAENSSALMQKKIDGQTALHTALQTQQEAMADDLMSISSDIEQTDALGQTALHIAADRSSPDIVRKLIARGSKIDAQAGNGQTPLIEAVGNLNRVDKLSTVHLLLQAKAQTNIVDIKGSGPLHMLSVYSPHMVRSKICNAIIRLLLSAHADPNKKNEQGLTPLQVHTRFLSPKNITSLIDHGADALSVDTQGQTLMHYAVRSHVEHHPDDFKETVGCLMQAGVIPDVCDNGGKTPLQLVRDLNKPDHMYYYLDIAQKGHSFLKSAPVYDGMYQADIVAVKTRILEAQLALIRLKKTSKPDYAHIPDISLTYEQELIHGLELDSKWLEVYAKTPSDKGLLRQAKLAIEALCQSKGY